MAESKKPHWAVRFAEETSLHGIPNVARGHNIWDICTWVVMTAVASIVMIVQSVYLAQLYQTVPTATVLSLARNVTIDFDNVVLCAMWDRNALYVDPDKLYFSSDSPSLDMNTTILGELLLNISDSDLNNIRYANGTIYEFDRNLLHLLLEMFSEAVNFETDYLPVFDNTMMFQISQVMWSTEAVRDIHDFFVLQQIPIENVYKFTAAQLCQVMSTELFLYKNGKNPDVICKPQLITYLNGAKFCAKVPQLQFSTWESSTTYGQISIDPSPILSNKNLNSTDFYFSLDFNGAPHTEMGLNRNEMYYNLYGDSSSIVISLQTEYQFYNTKRSPCISDTTVFDCESRCFATYFTNITNCWPLSFTYLDRPSNISTCTSNTTPKSLSNMGPSLNISDYQNLPSHLQPVSYIAQPCIESCIPECNLRVFQYTRSVIEPTVYNPPTTVVQFKVVKFIYQLIQEIPTKDWQTFLSEFGGLIGVWLGGSILAFVHIPMFIVKVIVSKLLARKHKENQTVVDTEIPMRY